MLIAWNDRHPGPRHGQGLLLDLLVTCPCGRKRFFRADVANIVWPAWLHLRDIARSLICTRCLAKIAMVIKVKGSHEQSGERFCPPPWPDVDLQDLVGWHAYALQWKHVLASGRLPPEEAPEEFVEEWDTDAIWANGIMGAPTLEEMLSAPDRWRPKKQDSRR